MKLDKSILITSTLTGLTLLTGAVLTSTVVSADDTDVIDQVNITVPVSCSMSGTGMNSHNKDIVNGTYQANIGVTTLKAFCNDSEGFSIYAAGYTGDEIGAETSNQLIGAPTNIGNIVTGTATGPNGGSDTSNWAMKLQATEGNFTATIDNDFDNYSAVPNEYTKVAHRDSNTDYGESAEGATLTTTYAAYISKTQPAGTYSGQVIYTLVHSSIAPALVVCNKNATTIEQAKCMQDFAGTNSQSIINSMTEEQTYTLTDKRDNKTYTISKLKDGNVWMTQNLDLDLDSTTTYTHEDTDLGYGTSTVNSWTPERDTYPSEETTWGELGENTETGYDFAYTHPESYDPGNLYVNPAMVEYNATGEGEQPESATLTSGAPQTHLGNYYNWTAALAMNDSSNYGKYNNDTREFENLDTDQSICPAGWTLPVQHNDSKTGYPANDPKSFSNLFTKYGWTDKEHQLSGTYKAFNSPLNFALSGVWYGVLEAVAYYGYFWSSVANDSSSARDLGLDAGGGVDPDDNGRPRNYGFTVRCVSR